MKDETNLGGPGNQVIWGMNVAMGGLIAVGQDTYGGTDAALWTSSDGNTWKRVPPDESIFGSDADQQMRWAIGYHRRVLASGFEDREVRAGLDRDAVVWTATLPKRSN